MIPSIFVYFVAGALVGLTLFGIREYLANLREQEEEVNCWLYKEYDDEKLEE